MVEALAVEVRCSRDVMHVYKNPDGWGRWRPVGGSLGNASEMHAVREAGESSTPPLHLAAPPRNRLTALSL